MNKVEFSRTAKVPFDKRYGNFIGGKWVEPRSGKYFENFSPVTGRLLCEIARSDANDIEARSTPPMRPRTPGAAPASPSAR